MTGIQKVIKYLAMTFAILLAIAIISGIIAVIGGVFLGTGLIREVSKYEERDYNSSEFIQTDVEQNVKYIDVEVGYTNLKIQKGEKLYAKTNNNDIEIKQTGNSLSIKEKNSKKFFWFDNDSKDLIIYIPEDMKFEKIELNCGAGRVQIDELFAEKVKFSFGAGKVEMSNIKAEEAKIETGAGQVSIDKSYLNDLKLDIGVGATDVTSIISGDSKVNCGIGKVTLNLIEDGNGYLLDINKGIGRITFNGDKISDKVKVGSGSNKIEINGGIGEIEINEKK